MQIVVQFLCSGVGTLGCSDDITNPDTRQQSTWAGRITQHVKKHSVPTDTITLAATLKSYAVSDSNHHVVWIWLVPRIHTPSCSIAPGIITESKAKAAERTQCRCPCHDAILSIVIAQLHQGTH